uniref:Uncharacterized protein n=1 Tax=Plectus sambesii TaxID=2011161 RepID=A0A914X9N5_9BILA
MNKSNVECKKIYWSDWIEENRYFAHNNSELYQYKSKVAPADPLWTGIVLDNVETYGKDSSIIGVEVEGTFSDLSVNHGMTEEMHHLNGNRFEFQEFEPSSTFHLPINDPHHIIALVSIFLCISTFKC